MNKYEKQKADLTKQIFDNKLYARDLIDLIIEAREQRDKYHKLYKEHKKANNDIADRLLRASNHIDKGQKLLKLH